MNYSVWAKYEASRDETEEGIGAFDSDDAAICAGQQYQRGWVQSRATVYIYNEQTNQLIKRLPAPAFA